MTAGKNITVIRRTSRELVEEKDDRNSDEGSECYDRRTGGHRCYEERRKDATAMIYRSYTDHITLPYPETKVQL